jgi:hypothetical protein
LIPFLYIFAALLKLAAAKSFVQRRYRKSTLLFAAISGLVTTGLAIFVAFFPAAQITSVFSYEVWMVGGTLLFVGLAAFFFFVYGRRKLNKKLAEGASVA